MQLFERPESGETALLVDIRFPFQTSTLNEFVELVASAGVTPLVIIEGSRQQPHQRYFVGTGKLDEIKSIIETHPVDVILFNHSLNPSQEKNIEQALNCRTLDRTGVILDIFAQRARSFEGKLQVELAQLNHMATRLVRGWTHLERQKGGIGLRGPGETQLETDRRLLGDRIRQLRKKLEKVKNQREQSRRSRKRSKIATISLIGYTNAGKSTLFNQLCNENIYAKDQLFATLDPCFRKITLDNNQNFVLADTVGFIRQLPHDLIEAFQATLQEVKEADLLLHVIDLSNDEKDEYIQQVDNVLSQVGAQDVPQILVYNKIDCVSSAQNKIHPQLIRDENDKVKQVYVSAQTGEGMDLLLQAINEFLSVSHQCYHIKLEVHQAKVRAEIYCSTEVISEQHLEDGGCYLEINCAVSVFQQLNKKYQLEKFTD